MSTPPTTTITPKTNITKTPTSPSGTTQPNPPAKAAHPKASSHYACHVREIRVGGGRDSAKKGVWTQIRAAWMHHDGNGFNLKFDCVPIDGRIVLRAADEERGN